MLYSLPVCPETWCLPKASRWVKRYGLRGCKSLSPHYYCRVWCRWQRADTAILWVCCLRSLLFWARIGSSPDPAAWVNEDWKIEQPGLFYVRGFLLSTCFPATLVRPHNKVSVNSLCAYPQLWINWVCTTIYNLRSVSLQPNSSAPVLREPARGERGVAVHGWSAEKWMSE